MICGKLYASIWIWPYKPIPSMRPERSSMKQFKPILLKQRQNLLGRASCREARQLVCDSCGRGAFLESRLPVESATQRLDSLSLATSEMHLSRFYRDH